LILILYFFIYKGNIDDAQVFYDMVVDINDKASQEENHFKLEKDNLESNESIIKRFALCCQGII
jgi:hypothetical protein